MDPLSKDFFKKNKKVFQKIKKFLKKK